MKGAREYARLFKTGQYGKLYITSSSHARGNTFRIQVLPKGEEAIPHGSINTCLNSNAIEVYGVTSGNPGWTESYGWLHEGKWQEDFYNLVDSKKKEIELKKQEELQLKEKKEQEKNKNIEILLSNY